VALVAETVKVDGLPEAIDGGFAVMFTVGAGSELPELGAIPEHPVNSNDRGRQDNSATEPTRREKERGTRSHRRLLFLPGSHEKRRSDALSRNVGSKFNRSISPHKLVSITPQHYGCQIEVPLRPTEFCLPAASTNGMQKVPKKAIATGAAG
jgi:hypothetical protein